MLFASLMIGMACGSIIGSVIYTIPILQKIIVKASSANNFHIALKDGRVEV
jgi:hypothetical protein